MSYHLKKNMTERERALCDKVAYVLTEGEKGEKITLTILEHREFKRVSNMVRAVAKQLGEPVLVNRKGAEVSFQRKEEFDLGNSF